MRRAATVRGAATALPSRAVLPPRAALWLGVAGALPFVLGAAAVAAGPDWLRATAFFHLTNYAGLVLAFAGAALWGFAAAGATSAAGGTAGAAGAGAARAAGAAAAGAAWFVAGAAPLAVAWLSLAAVHPLLRVSLLVLGFAAAFAVDLRAAKAGIAPLWYIRLRKPLTAVALVALGIVAVFAA